MKKLSLKSLDFYDVEILTRDQLKKVLGGLSSNPGGSDATCHNGQCTVYDSNTGVTYSGDCGFNSQGGGEFICECISADLGVYTPQNGTSACYY